jgi:WD40 repeat protein
MGGDVDYFVAVGFSSGLAAVWDLRERDGKVAAVQRAKMLVGHGGAVTSLALSSDGSRIVTGSDDRTARVWDSGAGKMLLELRGHELPVLCVAMSRHQPQTIVTGSADCAVRVWDALPEERLLQLDGVIDANSPFVFRTDGRFVVAGPPEREKRLPQQEPLLLAWNAVDGGLIDPPEYSLADKDARTPDGKYQFVRSGSRVVRVPIRIGDDERIRRLWLTRPDPAWHALRQKKFMADHDSYGAAMHQALEQRALGALALEELRVWDAISAIVAEAEWMPKPPALVELAPLANEPKKP